MPDERSAKSMMEEARGWDRDQLLEIWEMLKGGEEVPEWAPGKAFEYLVVQAFRLEGAEVRWPFQVTYPQKFGLMEQLDGLVYLEHRAFLLESKALTEPAAIEAVAKLRFRLESRPPATMAVLFSISDFTRPTEVFTQFASPLNVLLWARADLDIALRSESMVEGLRQKLEYAIEYGLPLYTFASVE